jgi:hypothetical protein
MRVGRWSGNGSIGGSSNLVINAGTTLDVSGRADGKLTLLNGQTLKGNGTLNGSLTASPGATVAPGTSLGLLTVSSAATLQGTTFMELNKTLGTNDVLQANGALTYGGALSLTNLSGALTNGDKFKLFAAGSYSNAFTGIVPAMPGSGLAWDASGLITNGTLRIVAAAQPKIASVTLAGTNLLTLTVTKGVPGSAYYILASTNLNLPLANWPIVATNYFDGNGSFIHTSVIKPDSPQQFYILRIP